MYEAEYARNFYNAYGDREWARLERSPHGRLQQIIHDDFIARYVKAGDRVLDAGCGPGRFSISMLRTGAVVTLLDISENQLTLARTQLEKHGMTANVEQLIRGDICDLSALSDGYVPFDAVVCFGGPLSYVCEKRAEAARELVRVTKPGGTILASVMSYCGTLLGLTARPEVDMLKDPARGAAGIPSVDSVLESHDLPGFPSSAGVMHAPMHLYTAKELADLFEGCQVLEVAGSNVMIPEGARPQAEAVSSDPAAWRTVIDLERRLNHDPGLVDMGSHIIIAVRRQA